jgi:hypothetical protein
MCIDCVLASSRIAQVDPGDEPLTEVVSFVECQIHHIIHGVASNLQTRAIYVTIEGMRY